MIKIYNRESKSYEIEKVLGENYIKWTYESPIGKSFLNIFLKRKLFSKLYGFFCDSKRSVKKIDNIINEYNINMNESIKQSKDFRSFNDFFTRKLHPSARPISKNCNDFVSPGDGRLLAFENIDLENIVQVKGFTYSLKELINDDSIADKYQNGTCLVLRLCPVDYHRFHFVDNGTISSNNKIKGYYYSVNPIALGGIKKLFCKNKREWSMLHSDNFGDILYIEVGATCVGTIKQTYTPNTKVSKGSEKGYFKFGGSTVILFLEKNKVKIDDDILSETKKNIETKVKMGETIGLKL
ncbi:Phosphatidylserine decarboxylase proenzyme 1 [Clostridium bornimense]|uniref:Phosphatidylserine decarboxylase proenzyme n=1 Tax=Clostridium bornimense TaxID=1216932 RepID=W6RRM2_9CLOT|nr:phosphatidylserine decarboxylase [Clostridium bornimense]CDM67226.1 Phosphatidylserine decarboxylase proenzyme 1 [Clostridium bornimense]